MVIAKLLMFQQIIQKTINDGIYKVTFSVTNHKLNKTYYVDGWYDQNANQTKISDIVVDGEMISK